METLIDSIKQMRNVVIAILLFASFALTVSAQQQPPGPVPPLAPPLETIEKAAELVIELQKSMQNETPIEPEAARPNGCGPEWLLRQTWLPDPDKVRNIRSFTGRVNGTLVNRTYPVNFEPACNLHDVGYAGLYVWNRIHGKPEAVRYSELSRRDVDERFRDDLKHICEKSIPDSSGARNDCKGRFGAKLYYLLVRRAGYWSYDCNILIDGLQYNTSCAEKRENKLFTVPFADWFN